MTFKKANLAVLVLILVGLVSACGTSSSTSNENEDTLTPVVVTITTDPAIIHRNQAVTIQAKVTQGTADVDDAEEAKFQIWEDGHQDQSDMIMAAHTGQGIYSVQKTFDDAGTYEVTAHVTARSMHTMPTKKLIVVK